MSAAPRARSLRSEAPVVLPLALALFAVLAGAALAYYRAAVARFAADRGDEAQALAERLLEESPSPAPARLDLLLRRLPPGTALALIDRQGRSLAAVGGIDDTLPPELVAELVERGRATADPARLGGSPRVVALLALSEPDEAIALRLDLPAAALAAEQRALAFLTPLIVAVAVATALVVILFFRALVRPYEALLARARAAPGADTVGARDETEFLLSTFDRALAALGAPEGDLAPLAGTLGASLDGGFLLLDPERRVLVATPAAAELLGQASPAAGKPLAEAFPAVPALAQVLDDADEATGGSSFRSLNLEGDATGRVIGCVAEPLRGEGGRLRGWLVVLGDRTESERLAARERLAQGLAQLGELSAGVAHELRNGLAALDGWLKLARRRPHASELADCLDEIERESGQLARVVEEFLAFARPGTRRLERCNLVDIARRAAADPVFAPPGIALELPETTAPLLADPLLLERAVRNLIANAVEAQRAAGRGEPVALALSGGAGAWRLAVEDRGDGVAEAVRGRLFEPFASGRPGGVGLGLALARRIAVLHRGEVRYAPAEGGGSRFVLELPALIDDNNDTQSNTTD